MTAKEGYFYKNISYPESDHLKLEKYIEQNPDSSVMIEIRKAISKHVKDLK